MSLAPGMATTPDSVASTLDAVMKPRATSLSAPNSVELLAGELVHERDGLVGEDVVGLDEDAELARAADLLLDRVDVLDRLGLLVRPTGSGRSGA